MSGSHGDTPPPSTLTPIEALLVDALIHGRLNPNGETTNTEEVEAEVPETLANRPELPDDLMDIWNGMYNQYAPPRSRAQQAGSSSDQVDHEGVARRTGLRRFSDRTDAATTTDEPLEVAHVNGHIPPVPAQAIFGDRLPAGAPSKACVRRRHVDSGVFPPPPRLPPPRLPPPPAKAAWKAPPHAMRAPPTSKHPSQPPPEHIADPWDLGADRTMFTRRQRHVQGRSIREHEHHFPTDPHNMRLTRIIVAGDAPEGLRALFGGDASQAPTPKVPSFTEQLLSAWTDSPLVQEAYKAFLARCLTCSSGGKSETSFRLATWLKARPCGMDAELVDVKKLRDALLEKVKDNPAFTDVSSKPDLISVKWNITPPAKRMRVGNMVMECKICQSSGALMAMRPCGHTVCTTCAEKLKEKCPFCRERVCEFITLYES